MKGCDLLHLLILLCGVLLLSCSKPTSLRPDDYWVWISTEENGLIKSRTIRNVRITARYLPAEYLAYKEFVGQGPDGLVPYDSLLGAYRCGLVFQLTLEADKNDPRYGSLLYYQTFSQEDLAARVRLLSFDISSFISLDHKGILHAPVLSNFEGADQIANKLTFQVSFIVEDYQCGVISPDFQNIRLSYEDPVWDLGTNHFLFEKYLFSGIPRLMF